MALSGNLLYLSDFLLSPPPPWVHRLWVQSYYGKVDLKFSLMFIVTNSYESRQEE